MWKDWQKKNKKSCWHLSRVVSILQNWKKKVGEKNTKIAWNCMSCQEITFWVRAVVVVVTVTCVYMHMQKPQRRTLCKANSSKGYTRSACWIGITQGGGHRRMQIKDLGQGGNPFVPSILSQTLFSQFFLKVAWYWKTKKKYIYKRWESQKRASPPCVSHQCGVWLFCWFPKAESKNRSFLEQRDQNNVALCLLLFQLLRQTVWTGADPGL